MPSLAKKNMYNFTIITSFNISVRVIADYNIVLHVLCVIYFQILLILIIYYLLLVSLNRTDNSCLGRLLPWSLMSIALFISALYSHRMDTHQLSEIVILKRFLKRNLADVVMAQRMHWLTKYITQECHTVLCTI